MNQISNVSQELPKQLPKFGMREWRKASSTSSGNSRTAGKMGSVPATTTGPAGAGGGATMAAVVADGIKLLAEGVVETALLAPPGCPVKRS
jgi:hypothetical protein